MIQSTEVPMCPCVDEDTDRAHARSDGPRGRRWQPLFAHVTWDDGRIDAVPALCQEVGIDGDELRGNFESIADVTVADEESRTDDQATMSVYRLSDDVYLKTVSGETGESTLIRGPIVDVLIEALGDWDGVWPLWDMYIKQLQTEEEDEEDEEEEGPRWASVDIHLNEDDKRALISRLTR